MLVNGGMEGKKGARRAAGTGGIERTNNYSSVSLHHFILLHHFCSSPQHKGDHQTQALKTGLKHRLLNQSGLTAISQMDAKDANVPKCEINVVASESRFGNYER